MAEHAPAGLVENLVERRYDAIDCTRLFRIAQQYDTYLILVGIRYAKETLSMVLRYSCIINFLNVIMRKVHWSFGSSKPRKSGSDKNEDKLGLHKRYPKFSQMLTFYELTLSLYVYLTSF